MWGFALDQLRPSLAVRDQGLFATICFSSALFTLLPSSLRIGYLRGRLFLVLILWIPCGLYCHRGPVPFLIGDQGVIFEFYNHLAAYTRTR